MANGYTEELTLDRVDNDGNYEPGNCRWVTQKEQNRNRGTHRRITAFGETKIMAEWLEDERCKTGRGGLEFRLGQGMDPELAITTPSRVTNRKSMKPTMFEASKDKVTP
ncbi:MAG: hypothetical protein P4L67_04675 [Candidatus Pacebacteria bacterium]|nr:hypothetical protein [Candidatus Paceibacterota bacterium]